MAYIAIHELSYAHPGGELLFTDVSFRVSGSSHVGLVGVNGVGKSTLLKLIIGHLSTDIGTVTTSGKLAYMSQDIGRGTVDQTIREIFLDTLAPSAKKTGYRLIAAENEMEGGSEKSALELAVAVNEWADIGGYDLESRWDRTTMRILGEPFEAISHRRVSTLSGGEGKQIALDALFSSDSEILLLDEPDNYLDIPGKRWLEKCVRESEKLILIISHDRELLSEATNKILTLEGSGCWIHGSSFADYAEARMKRNADLGDALTRWKEEERRLFHYYKLMKQRAAQNSGNASRANAAQSRWERFVDNGPPPPPIADKTISVKLVGNESARRAVKLESVGIDDIILPFTFDAHYGDRIGVIGNNGSGKSHLLNTIYGIAMPSEGRVVLGSRVNVGIFTQSNQKPEFSQRVLTDIVSDHVPEEEKAMRALARYGLQDAASRRFETLSGGQKARLEILCLEADGCNLLLLDEPTDNLDIDSSTALEGALDQFRGTLFAVSHDRHFLRTLKRFLYLSDDGGAYELDDYDSALDVLKHPDRIFSDKRVKELTSFS